MKKHILIFAVAFNLSAVAYAETESTSLSASEVRTKMILDSEDGSVSSKGFRFSIVSPYLTEKIAGVSNTSSSTPGIGIGYANLPVRDLGITTKLAYIPGQPVWVLDCSLGYAINSTFNFKGGVNVSDIVTPEANAYYGSIKPGVGFQAGVGIQFSRYVGIDADYVLMSQNLPFLQLVESGPELSLNATF